MGLPRRSSHQTVPPRTSVASGGGEVRHLGVRRRDDDRPDDDVERSVPQALEETGGLAGLQAASAPQLWGDRVPEVDRDAAPAAVVEVDRERVPVRHAHPERRAGPGGSRQRGGGEPHGDERDTQPAHASRHDRTEARHGRVVAPDAGPAQATCAGAMLVRKLAAS
jgi:hypothetical protein